MVVPHTGLNWRNTYNKGSSNFSSISIYIFCVCYYYRCFVYKIIYYTELYLRRKISNNNSLEEIEEKNVRQSRLIKRVALHLLMECNVSTSTNYSLLSHVTLSERPYELPIERMYELSLHCSANNSLA